VVGIAKDTPLCVITPLQPAGLLGGLVVGSGKPPTPCARMHSEIASICVLAAADGSTEPGPPPGRSLPHVFWAARKDGDAGLIPELLLMLMWEPPLEVVGSGKFRTPCERMHDENLIPATA